MSRDKYQVPATVLTKIAQPLRDKVANLEALVLEYLPDDDREEVASHLYIGHLIVHSDPKANVTIVESKHKNSLLSRIGLLNNYPTLEDILPEYKPPERQQPVS